MSRIAKAAAAALGTGAVVISGAGLALADAGAEGMAAGSPGVVSGNAVQVPVNIPVNVCGNTADLVGLLNPAFGSRCANNGGLNTPGNPGYPGPGDDDHDHDDYGDSGYGD
ncbi:chaplin [Streptomyces sp. NPDC051896]|uniref:chaplin n=1 Tax=Streptomyces sp. NPDC051896 TaxID=3155416 RepID=UPI00341B0AD4